MSLQSRHLFTLFLTLHPAFELGQTPAGSRRTTPYFETAAPQHAWLNQIVAVAQGGRRPGGVEYEVFEIL
ncbi:hypothetical protein FHS26_006079 [Rhizobium pisi]|uniref:DUF3237 family protein n=1 Tax=Rhizobium pisi TaxID=574561 RepID=A0A3R9GUW3_9HYPH|nr:DUF3237 family protein [Rhizobium pisi]MBB3138301.1 hypothetical protein [Rhizobium pisi]RSB63453.1 DUF3237 family protein [Rhizobium pisi]